MNTLDPGARNLISFIVPAHNEEFGLSKTLDAIHQSARTVGHPYELIVVNDASTDRTAEIALRHGAVRIDVQHCQIAKTRNSGGRAARGHRLFFVDADTTVTPSALRSALRAMDKGAAGGGAHTRFEGSSQLGICGITRFDDRSCRLLVLQVVVTILPQSIESVRYFFGLPAGAPQPQHAPG